MIDLTRLSERQTPLKLLCLGAHSDDIEIGCGGTVLSLIASGVPLHIEWCVLSGDELRQAEAMACAQAFTSGAHRCSIQFGGFEDSYFPAQTRQIKAWLMALRDRFTPDLVFTHGGFDAHQDHRTVQELTWNVFRDQLVLEYEIPKWDGDISQPNTYVALAAQILDKKIDLLMQHFSTQRCKDWFDRETFRAIARLRGMECRAPDRFAEGFHARKLRLL
ncbi:PIG-L family deacetylase [Ochrobactrum sp. Sa2BUA5]|nr:PIG-L family deacetylase [Ochrobactrum gallinarum]